MNSKVSEIPRNQENVIDYEAPHDRTTHVNKALSCFPLHQGKEMGVSESKAFLLVNRTGKGMVGLDWDAKDGDGMRWDRQG